MYYINYASAPWLLVQHPWECASLSQCCQKRCQYWNIARARYTEPLSCRTRKPNFLLLPLTIPWTSFRSPLHLSHLKNQRSKSLHYLLPPTLRHTRQIKIIYLLRHHSTRQNRSKGLSSLRTLTTQARLQRSHAIVTVQLNLPPSTHFSTEMSNPAWMSVMSLLRTLECEFPLLDISDAVSVDGRLCTFRDLSTYSLVLS